MYYSQEAHQTIGKISAKGKTPRQITDKMLKNQEKPWKEQEKRNHNIKLTAHQKQQKSEGSGMTYSTK